MLRLLTLVAVAVVLYAIATAAPDRKAAMLEGVKAVGWSVRDACLRTEPCRRVAGYVGSWSSAPRFAYERSPSERPLLER